MAWEHVGLIVIKQLTSSILFHSPLQRQKDTLIQPLLSRWVKVKPVIMVFFHALILTAVKNCKNWERIKTDLQQPWPRLMWKPMKTVLSFVPTNHIWDNKKNMAAPMLKKKNLVKTVFSKVLCPLTCQPQIPTPDLLVADSDARPVNPRSWYPTWQPQIGPISQSQIVIPDQTTPDNLALVCQPPKSREVGGVQYAPAVYFIDEWCQWYLSSEPFHQFI